MKKAALKTWTWLVAGVAIAASVTFLVAGPPAPGEEVYGLHYDAAAGEPLYNSHCAACHDHPSGRTPAKSVIAGNTPAFIFAALTDGVMRPYGEGLPMSDKVALIMYLSQNKSGGQVSRTTSQTPTCADEPGPVNLAGSGWNGWGRTVENTRYQPDPGLAAADAPRLKLKWAVALSGTRNGEPMIAGGRLFTNDTSGSVYALNARTGCAYWRFTAEGQTRSTISLAPIQSQAGGPARVAAFFTDAGGSLYAIDAQGGGLIWRTSIDNQPGHQFTGSVTVFNGVVYAPVSSGEEAFASSDAYPCCKFRGALVAVRADTGKILWTTYTTPVDPKPSQKNRAGTQMYGPAGGAIWSAPTIDAVRGLAYVTTGNSYTGVPHSGSDAGIALELKTGKIVWINQLTTEDSYIIGCYGAPERRHANCPTVVGTDFDLGASPALVRRPDGKQVILVSQKSGQVYALDPAHQGQVIWEKRLSPGGPLGGSEFGHAVDERNIYVGISDIYRGTAARPQLSALGLADGALAWTHPLTKLPCRWTNEYCIPGISMAVTAMPGLVFAGSMDGWLRAYLARDGKIIWSFDTAQPVTTTTGGQAMGGALDGAGPVAAGGMVYVDSGYWGRTGPGSVLLAFSVDGK